MSTSRTVHSLLQSPARDALTLQRALRIWLKTGSVPVAHIVAEPDAAEEDTIEASAAA